MTICSNCGARSFSVTCPRGKRHFVTQHNEGSCPSWYDVGGCFEDDYCCLCHTMTLSPRATGPNPFE